MIRFFKFACLWVAACSLAFLAPAQNLQHRRKAFRSAPATFTAYTAGFDGSSDWIRKTTAMTNCADAQTFTFSAWVDFTAGDAALQYIFTISDSTTNNVIIYKDTSNKINVFGRTGGGTTKVNFKGATSIVAADTVAASNNYHHIYVCVDTSASSNSTCKIYIDGVEESYTFTTSASSASGTGFDLTPSTPRYTIGGDGATTATNKMTASICELVFANSYLDSPSSFRDASRPKDIGSTGSTPFGAAPDLYLSLTASGGDNWVNDSSGNSNNFTVTGALGTPTAP